MTSIVFKTLYIQLYVLYLQVSRLMLISGASADTRTEYYERAPPICVASVQGHTDFVSLLLEFGANPNLTGNSPFNKVHACHCYISFLGYFYSL